MFQDIVGMPQWDVAMDEEANALDENETWKLTPLPEGKKAIGCKWVYKTKHNVEGSVSTYKARLVTKGYGHTYGIDHEETFQPSCEDGNCESSNCNGYSKSVDIAPNGCQECLMAW